MNNKERYMTLLQGLEVEVPDGYFFSETFNHFQKVNDRVYVYITPGLCNRWTVQAYKTGTAAVCSLEARINWVAEGEGNNMSESFLIERLGRNIQKLFHLAEIWLEKYGKNPEGMVHDEYNPFNEKGWMGYDLTKKDIYIHL